MNRFFKTLPNFLPLLALLALTAVNFFSGAIDAASAVSALFSLILPIVILLHTLLSGKSDT